MDTEVAVLKHVSVFGYLSKPDNCNDKRLLRDKVNEMLIDCPKHGWNELSRIIGDHQPSDINRNIPVFLFVTFLFVLSVSGNDAFSMSELNMSIFVARNQQ